MAERKDTDGVRMPESPFEAWLRQQFPDQRRNRHEVPVPELFEPWIGRRARRRQNRRGPGR